MDFITLDLLPSPGEKVKTLLQLSDRVHCPSGRTSIRLNVRGIDGGAARARPQERGGRDDDEGSHR
jgi:hypothetical protein